MTVRVTNARSGVKYYSSSGRSGMRPPDGPRAHVPGLAGSLQQFVGLDDRFGELGHGNSPVLALPLKQAERLVLAEMAARHEDSLGAFDQLALAQGHLQLVDVLLKDLDLPGAGHGDLDGRMQARGWSSA